MKTINTSFLIHILILILITIVNIHIRYKVNGIWWDYEHQRRAQITIDSIEKFKRDYGRLPSDSEANTTFITMQGPFYLLVDSNNYLVHYDYGFDGDSYCYYSKTKKWQYGTSLSYE